MYYTTYSYDFQFSGNINSCVRIQTYYRMYPMTVLSFVGVILIPNTITLHN